MLLFKWLIKVHHKIGDAMPWQQQQHRRLLAVRLGLVWFGLASFDSVIDRCKKGYICIYMDFIELIAKCIP